MKLLDKHQKLRQQIFEYFHYNEDYTMIVVDTHTDGNQYLQIFDNSKEVK